MNNRNIYFIAVVVLLGCSTTKKVATTNQDVKPALSEAAQQGQALYENNCKKCHRLYGASEFTAERWPGILNSMQKKANITDQQKELIYGYLAIDAKKQ